MHTDGSSAKAEHVVTGEVRQSNAAGHDVWVDQLLMGDQDHRAGILIPNAFKHMGFARLTIGKEIRLVYIAFPDGNRQAPRTVFFDSSRFTDVADRIRYMKFIYTNDDKWLLQLYDRSEEDDGDLLKEIDGLQEPEKGKPLSPL
jgi:hypothetical protein